MRHIAVSTPVRQTTVIDTRRDAPIRTRLMGSTSRLALSVASAVLASSILASTVLVLGVALPGEARAQSAVNPVQTTTYRLTTNPTIFGGATNIDVFDTAVIGGGVPFDVTVQVGARIVSTKFDGVGILLDSGSVTNEGGTISGGYGVFLSNTGVVTNAGAITGLYNSIVLDNGGSVTNQAGGTIRGGNYGVYIKGGAGTVTNAGDITGSSGDGIFLGAGGSVTNRAGGTISGGSDGVLISGGAGTVTNAGAITGTNGAGILLRAGGSVDNQATGTISGGSDGIRMNGAGSVANAGSITGDANGVTIVGGGNVSNKMGGTISGGDQGVLILGGVGTVDNAGAITATSAATFGDGISLTTGGSVTNYASGSVSGVRYGVVILGVGGSVTNQAGGVITGGSVGVGILSGTGTVNNAGNMVATAFNGYAVHLGGGGSVTNQGGGTISAGGVGVFVAGGAGAVMNAGSITAGTGVDLEAGGSVTNQAGGTISGSQNGVFVAGSAGTVSNAGSITGTSDRGVQLDAGGSVTNLAGGTISGRIVGVAINGGAGTVTNAGVISGGVGFAAGIALLAGGSVTNQAGGTIYGGFFGVGIQGGAGTVTNAGTITGTSGVAVQFAGSGANTLILQTGSVLNGNAVGSTAAGATNALLLQGIGRADNDFLNFDTLDVQASGLWALNGVSAFGATMIDSGTLVVGDAGHSGAALTGDVTVNAGGALAGAGTVIGDISVLSGGAIAPGAAGAVSTLNVTGNVIFNAGSFYRINIGGAQSDRLVLSGIAALGGATVQTVYVGAVQHSYNILHADGGLGGSSFAAVTSNSGGFSQTLSYTPTDVILTLSAQLGAGAGLNGNQQNVADSINNFFNAGGNLPAGFAGLFALDGAPLGTALSQISGEAATGAQQGVVQMMTDFLGLMNDPTGDGGGAGSGALGFAPERAAATGEIRQAYAAVLKAPPLLAPPFEQRWNVWASGFGGGSRIGGDATAGSSNVSARAYGVAAGADYRVAPNTRIGFAISGGGTNWNLAQDLGSGTGNAFQAGLYGKTSVGPAYLAASLAVANHWMWTSRTAFGGDHLTAEFDAQSYGGRIEGGYRFATAFAGITPYAAAQAQLFRTPRYSETDVSGGGFGLNYAARDATAVRSELGSRFDRELALVNTDAVMTLRGRLAWAHDWISDPSLTATFQGLPGASFVVTGARPATDSALVSAGSELRWRAGWSLAIRLDGEFASQAQTYTGTGTLRYHW